jgi:hypothetical protein
MPQEAEAMSGRCELSDLPVDQCACRVHVPVSITPRQPMEYVITARFPARFDSECDACGNAMSEGDPIARTNDGDYICWTCST